MAKLLALVVAAFVGCMVISAVAFKLLGPAGLLVVIVLFIVAVWALFKIGGKLLKSAFTAPFKAKSAVLKGATAEVHEVVPAPSPEAKSYGDEDDLDDEDREEMAGRQADIDKRKWFFVDVTITPKPPEEGEGGPFSHWDASELELIPPDRNTDPFADDDEDDEEDETCLVQDVKLWIGDKFVSYDAWEDAEDEEDADSLDWDSKGTGVRRLQLHVGVKSTEPLAFNYYFEKFGEVRFPS